MYIPYTIAGNYCGSKLSVKIQHFAEKTLTDCQSELWDGSYYMYVDTSTNFHEKTLLKGGNTAKFVKVFTCEIFRLHSICICIYTNVHVYEIMPNMYVVLGDKARILRG